MISPPFPLPWSTLSLPYNYMFYVLSGTNGNGINVYKEYRWHIGDMLGFGFLRAEERENPSQMEIPRRESGWTDLRSILLYRPLDKCTKRTHVLRTQLSFPHISPPKGLEVLKSSKDVLCLPPLACFFLFVLILSDFGSILSHTSQDRNQSAHHNS